MAFEQPKNSKKLMEGLYYRENLKNRLNILFVHYMADEDKRSKEWKAIASEGMSVDDWEREMEMNTEIEGSYKGVFKNSFFPNAHIKDLKYNPQYPIIRGWDFGFHHPTVLFCQHIDNTLYVLREIIGSDIQLRPFIVNDVLPYGEIHFGKNVLYEDYCDRAGSFKKDADMSSIEILNAFEIHPSYRQFYIHTGIKLIEILLATNRLIFDMSCEVTTTAMMGGYRWDANGQQPLKDNINDHCPDILRYVTGHIFNIAEAIKPAQEKEETILTPMQSVFTDHFKPNDDDNEFTEDNNYVY